MTGPIQTKDIHHLTLTVTNLERSSAFYTSLLGFQVVMELSPERYLLSNGKCIVALSLPPNPSRALKDDVFNENRVGIDHLSFSVNSLDDLKGAQRLLDQNNVSHGDIKDLGSGLGIYVMAFRDPDNIQLELTAPYDQ
jgi:glyoxylase I family protein